MKTTRGRPAKTVNTSEIAVSNLSVKFLCIKEDKYKNAIGYFKIVDDKIKSKMKVMLALTSDPTLIMPIWKSDKDEFLIKVKVKQMIYPGSQLKPLETYSLNFEFIQYDFESDGKNIKGYYSKLVGLGVKAKEVVEEVETDTDLEV
jgi:hypothetical protein